MESDTGLWDSGLRLIWAGSRLLSLVLIQVATFLLLSGICSGNVFRVEHFLCYKGV